MKLQKQQNNTPVLRKGNFNLNKVAGTYLDLSSWGKSVVWVNGHNLGRHWNIGPQQTLYLPAEHERTQLLPVSRTITF